MRTLVPYFFLCLLLCCLCACGHGSYPAALHRADSLADACPDSARALLARWADSVAHAPERVRMYHALLTVKAADKAYVRHTSDTVIKDVVAYYEDGADPWLLPEAYYYAGRVYSDLGDAPQALDYFERAAEALPPKGREMLAGKIYSQMGTLFEHQQMHEEALEMYRRSYAIEVDAEDVRGQIFSLRDIGGAFQSLEQPDSALVYTRKAYLLASAHGAADMQSLVQGQQASLYIQLQQYDSAEVCLREAFKQVHKASRSGLYAMASRDCGTVYGKEMAYFALAQMAMRSKNTDKALDYFAQSFVLQDSIRRMTNTETIRRMHSLYNYRWREKENQELKMEKQQRQFVFYAALGLCVLLLAVAFGYVQYVRRKRTELQQRLEYANRVKEEAEQRSERFIRENEQKIAVLEQQLREADAVRREQLQRQKEMMEWENKQALAALEKQRLLEEAMAETDIRKELSGQHFADNTGNKSLRPKDWQRVASEVETLSPGFKEKLFALYPRFSDFEYHLCLLIRLGIRPVDMAGLTAHGKESITAARRRMYEKVFRKKGSPGDWDKIILYL